MKLIIDIDDNVFTRLFDNGVDTSSEDRKVIDRSVRNGKPYEERPTGEWIPVSEKMPNESGRYLLTQCYLNFKTILIKYYDLGKKEFGTWRELPLDDEEVWVAISDITAWMPLPEAYKEAENE